MEVQFKTGKTILVEKYTKPTEIIQNGDNDIIYLWKNSENKMFRKNGLPALVQIINNKLIQIWFSSPGIQKIILKEKIKEKEEQTA